MNLEDIEDMLNYQENNSTNIPQENLQEQYVNNWHTYYNNVQSQVNTMWNFMLYNKFNNKEILNLHDKINEKNIKYQKLSDDYNSLAFTNDNLKCRNKILKRKLIDLEEKETPSKKKNKVDLLSEEFQVIENYESDLVKKDDELLKIFQNINCISDIVKLKDSKYKFDFVKDLKFNKLYNLIPVLEELDNIIGMTKIKESVFNTISYFLHGLDSEKELNHVMITGPPGVGKTTLAKIIGKIYLALEFLENNNFLTVRRSDLIAKYLGQTAIKTQEVIDKALGGVLFIDEVYSLGCPGKKDSFAKECIDTINLNMTEAKKPWLLIVGGYKEDIEQSFLAFNQGLERRFTVRMNLEGYNAKELYLILLKFIKDNDWYLEDNCINLEDIENNLKYFKFFAGDMQKVFQKAKHYYSLRLMKTSLNLDKPKKILIRNDIIESIEHLKSNLPNEDNLDDNIKISMYT